MVGITREITAVIKRFDPKRDKEPHYQEFRVKYKKGMRVLDAIMDIQRHQDPSLAYRWNCRAGICGSCAMEIDGKPCLACKTAIEKDRLTIEPMKAFPVIKDLVPDIDEVREKLARLKPYFDAKPEEAAKDGFFIFQDYELHEQHEAHECIECYICYDSCHVTRNHKELGFCGPSNVVKAINLDRHPLDVGDRFRLLNTEGNIWQCNMTRCCSENCPQDIRITENFITYAKERIVEDNNPVLRLIRRIKGGER